MHRYCDEKTITARPRVFLPRLGRKKCRTSLQQKDRIAFEKHFETQNLVHAIVCACVCANSMRLYFPHHFTTRSKESYAGRTPFDVYGLLNLER